MTTRIREIEANRGALGCKLTSLERLSLKKEDSTRYQCHGLFPYPAMMVPRLQGALMGELLEELPKNASIYDPFMGSGTVLSESLSRGRDFYGTDINPLSLLCCEVKSDVFDAETALRSLEQVRSHLYKGKEPTRTQSFPGADKWFPLSVSKTLTRIGDEIRRIENLWCRRMLWLSLAEVTRRVSRSRLSTYKLHIDKLYETPSSIDIIQRFNAVVDRNINLKRGTWEVLEKRGLLNNGAPSSKVWLELADARCVGEPFEVDLVVTSPPYGDNQTTVAYGQFSYLPLQFIDLDDIDSRFDRSVIGVSSGIDSVSLGGGLRSWREKMVAVQSHSESLSAAIEALKVIGRGGEKRLAAFSYDLRQALIEIAQHVRPGGYWMVTLGNRRINGMQIPLNAIVLEFLYALGFSSVAAINRTICKKRMAGSMSAEQILVLKKCR